MGILLNPDNTDFQIALNSEIYVDKSELINYTNKSIYTEQRFICVSRPRRFGKSMAANMLVAYYSRGCDSKEMFSRYKISETDSFEKHLNKYNVIHINMVEFLIEYNNIKEMLNELSKSVLFEVINEYPDVNYYDSTKLVGVNCQLQIGQKLFSRKISFKLNGREITERAVDAKIIEPMNIISEFKF